MTARELYESGFPTHGGFRLDEGIWTFCVVGWGWAGVAFLTPNQTIRCSYGHMGFYYYPDVQARQTIPTMQELSLGADDFSVQCLLSFSGAGEVLRERPQQGGGSQLVKVNIPLRWVREVDITQDILDKNKIRLRLNQAVLDGWGDYVPPDKPPSGTQTGDRWAAPLASSPVLYLIGENTFDLDPIASLHILPFRYYYKIGQSYTWQVYGDAWSLCKVFYKNTTTIEIKGTRVLGRTDEKTIQFTPLGNIPLSITYKWNWKWNKPKTLPLNKLVFREKWWQPEGVQLNLPFAVYNTEYPHLYFRRLCYFAYKDGTPIAPTTFFPFFQFRTLGGYLGLAREFLLSNWEVGIDKEKATQINEEGSQFGSFNAPLPEQMHLISVPFTPSVLKTEPIRVNLDGTVYGTHTYYKYTLVPETEQALAPFPSGVIPILLPAGGLGTTVEISYPGAGVSSLIRIFVPIPKWWVLFLTDLGGLVPFYSPVSSKVKLGFSLWQDQFGLTWNNYYTPRYEHYFLTDKGVEGTPDTRNMGTSFFKIQPNLGDYVVSSNQLEVLTPTERRKADLEQGGVLVRWLWRKLP